VPAPPAAIGLILAKNLSHHERGGGICLALAPGVGELRSSGGEGGRRREA